MRVDVARHGAVRSVSRPYRNDLARDAAFLTSRYECVPQLVQVVRRYEPFHRLRERVRTHRAQLVKRNRSLYSLLLRNSSDTAAEALHGHVAELTAPIIVFIPDIGKGGMSVAFGVHERCPFFGICCHDEEGIALAEVGIDLLGFSCNGAILFFGNNFPR